jgi:hypothetical protein
MTHPGYDGLVRETGEIRGAGEVAGYRVDAEEQDDPLRDVRHLLDRLYTAEGGSESTWS